MSAATRVNRLIWALALGYCATYTLYAFLVKAMTTGLVGGVGMPTGMEILPSVIAGTTLALPVIVLLLGWGRHLAPPSTPTVIAGAATAIIIATTTLAYTFAGVSILLSMLLLRGSVLILAPIVDAICRRRVRWFSSVAMGISITAVMISIAASADGGLTTAALLNTLAYAGGYALRLSQMTRNAKVEDAATTRRWFVQETAVALVLLAIATAGGAWVNDGLRRGISLLFHGEAAALLGLLIGTLYAVLFTYGTLIYLDRRENSFCIPLNRGASLIAGVLASYALYQWLGGEPPLTAELIGVALTIVAFLFLSPLHHLPEWAFAALAARRGARKVV